jgi:hypothetical protein
MRSVSPHFRHGHLHRALRLRGLSYLSSTERATSNCSRDASTLMTPSRELGWKEMRLVDSICGRRTSAACSGDRHCNRNVSLTIELGGGVDTMRYIMKTAMATITKPIPIP